MIRLTDPRKALNIWAWESFGEWLGQKVGQHYVSNQKNL